MKKIVALVLALMLALSMLTVATAETANPVAGKKVAYIMLLPSATIFQMWKDSCADLCAALDVEFDFYFCDGDFNRWMDTINTCAAAGYDGLLVSHGNQDGSYVFLKELTEKYPELKLVCFDTQFYTDGEYQKIEGVTQLFQQDKSLVTVLLDEMIAKFGEGVRLVKVWRGPNYNSPFDRREVGWQEYEAAGKIVTVGEIQPLQDSVDSANSVTAAYLQSLNREDVDGVIAYYDLYGQGVYNAIFENANFNGEAGEALPMASVDIDPGGRDQHADPAPTSGTRPAPPTGPSTARSPCACSCWSWPASTTRSMTPPPANTAWTWLRSPAAPSWPPPSRKTAPLRISAKSPARPTAT